MSKIQKALKALRNSSKNDASSRVQASEKSIPQRQQEAGLIHSPRVRNSSEAHVELGSTKSFDGTRELVPQNSIELSIEDLESTGLQPNEKDMAVIAQQFRRIKRPIITFAFESEISTGGNTNVVMMASALPGAGKSFCAFNLSQSVSLERDVGAVLIDADVLKPSISRSLGLQDSIGLIDYLVDTSIQLEDILVQTNLNNIVVVPAGRQHPEATELLASRRMQDLVALLSQQYKSRVVVFDMPPLLLTSEAQVLAGQSGQIVMIIEARVSSQESATRALALLDRQKPINAILNKSRSALNGGYQNDDYGYVAYAATANSTDGNT